MSTFVNPNAGKNIKVNGYTGPLYYEFTPKSMLPTTRVNFIDPSRGWIDCRDVTPSYPTYKKDKSKYLEIPNGVYSDLFYVTPKGEFGLLGEYGTIRGSYVDYYFKSTHLSDILRGVYNGNFVRQRDVEYEKHGIIVYKVYFTTKKQGVKITLQVYDGEYPEDMSNPIHIDQFYP